MSTELTYTSEKLEKPEQLRIEPLHREENKDRTLYLFVDKLAFEHLCNQPECFPEAKNAVITGYETYLVEEWALERRANVCLSSYTGNDHHQTEVQIVSVPGDVALWSTETRKTFEELASLGVHPQETPMGNMLIAALSSFPSNLTLISMSEQFSLGYAQFIVNENLRRLGVVNRIAVTCAPPNDAASASLRRSFAVNVKVNPSFAVLEIVTLVQIGLFYFGLIKPEFVDGLLCNNTMAGVHDWWSLFGQSRFPNAAPRPEDKMYMRVSSCAIIGVVIGARQRLSALGLKPPKDPFNCVDFLKCVKRFQKLVKVDRSSHLDSHTYFKLVQETSKISSFSGGTVLNAMKSTVKEGFSGKAAGAVEDWETLDIETLAENAKGHRCKYLWQGKGEPNVLHLDSVFATQAKSALKIPLFSLPIDQVDEQIEPIPTEKHHRPSFKPHGIHQRLLRHERESQPKETKNDSNGNEHDEDFKDFYARELYPDDFPDAKRTEPKNADVPPLDRSSVPPAQEAKPTLSLEIPDEKQGNQAPSFAPSPKAQIRILCTKDDSCMPKQERPPLLRSSSLGEIQTVIFPYKPLISLPRIICLRHSAGKLQTELLEQAATELETEQKLVKKTGKLERIANDIDIDNGTISYHARTIQRRTATISQRILDLEALTARIDYEMAMLKVKIRDADQSVRAFSSKIESFDRKFRAMK